MHVLQEVLRWGGAVLIILAAAIAELLSVSSRRQWPKLPRPHINWRPHVRMPRPHVRPPHVRPPRVGMPKLLGRLSLPTLSRDRLRRWTPALVVAVAVVAAVLSVIHVTVSPPGLTFSAQEAATARASVVVDTPDSIVADLRQSTENLQTLDDRSAVLGSVIGSPPVRDYVARVLKVPRSQVEIVPPGMEPEAAAAPYQMSIGVNAEVPILDLQATAPTGASAVTFANAAVIGLRRYMTSLAARQDIHAADRVRVTRVGGAVLDYEESGPDWTHGFIVFALVLTAAYVGLGRIVRARGLEAPLSPGQTA